MKDSGIGIREQYKEIIFQRFRQGDDLTKQFTEGTGLGLSISKGFVEMLGGIMWVESEFGKESTFYFTIPYDAEVTKEITAIDSSSGISAFTKVKKLTILVVEDDKDTQQLMTIVLKKSGKNYFKQGQELKRLKPIVQTPTLIWF